MAANWGSAFRKSCVPGLSLGNQTFKNVSYLGGQGDLVSGLITPTARVTTWVIGIMNLPTKLLSPPDPPSRSPKVLVVANRSDRFRSNMSYSPNSLKGVMQGIL